MTTDEPPTPRSSTPTGPRSTSTTRTSASSRSTSTRRPTSRATSRAPSAGTGRASCPTASAATSRRARTSRALLSESGIGPDTTIVLYGDNNNWFAAWAYWQLKLYGHEDVRIIDGGRKYWLDNGLPLSTDVPIVRRRRATSCPRPTSRCGPSATTSCRASATPSSRSSTSASPAEFNGEIIAPPGMSETAQRPGHIPGAASHPVGADRQGGRHVQGRGGPARRCTRPRASRRTRTSSPTAGSASARRTRGSSCTSCSATSGSATTTGSWTEYGSLIGVPIEKPAPVAAEA